MTDHKPAHPKSWLAAGALLLLLVAACSPTAATPAPAQPSPTNEIGPTVQPPSTLVPEPSVTAEASLVSTPLPVATSRGPNLEATDPGSVSLASGGLQLVEFFRFT